MKFSGIIQKKVKYQPQKSNKTASTIKMSCKRISIVMLSKNAGEVIQLIHLQKQLSLKIINID
jgi:hypothetical protein